MSCVREGQVCKRAEWGTVPNRAAWVPEAGSAPLELDPVNDVLVCIVAARVAAETAGTVIIGRPAPGRELLAIALVLAVFGPDASTFLSDGAGGCDFQFFKNKKAPACQQRKNVDYAK